MSRVHARVTVDGVAHPVAGAQVAIVRDGRVLLQLRPWPPGWELPGGHCGADEDPATTAVREAEEETGHVVRITALAGVYEWRGWRTGGDALYVGEIVGGTPHRSIESLRTLFVRPPRLPRTVFPWIPQRVEDALSVWQGGPPVHRVQPVHLRHMLFFGGQWAAFAVDALRRRRRRR